ncbi:hypothetical protein Esti_001865 [Eimeria stiedai]
MPQQQVQEGHWLSVERDEYKKEQDSRNKSSNRYLFQAWNSVLIGKAEGGCFCRSVKLIKEVNRDYAEAHAISFFSCEYQLDLALAEERGPVVVSVWDGIVFGGGVGLTVHGGLRICTEKTVFSMPEVHIGLFPDCGMTQRLATLQPAGLGLFLGLTGAKLKAADLMRTRLATHYVPCSEVEHALEKLKQGPPLGVNTKEWASQVLIEAGMPPGVPASRLPEAGQLLTLEMEQFLKLYFAQPDSLQNLLLSLEKGAKSCPLCASALQQMKSACPLSLAVTFKAIRDRQHATVTKSATNGGRREAGAAENATFSSSRTAAEQQRQHNLELLRDAMAIELVLICNMTAFTNYNFKEGIRALLLDKDKNPKWRPSTIEEVMMIDVEQLFAPQRPLGPSKL